MKGKSVFTRDEADKIIRLIREKVISNQSEQKKIRDKIRKIGFYASDFGIGGGYKVEDFIRVVKILDNNGTQVNKSNIKSYGDSKKNIEKDKLGIIGTNKLVQSFPPIYSTKAQCLILGTMPGAKSLSLNEYYAHGGNQFWTIMFECFGKEYSPNYSEKKKLLIDNNVALWDVLCYCERKGSADSEIENEVPNKIAEFCNNLPELKYIFFNGSKAEELYFKHNERISNINYCRLTSTSSANTSMTKQGKIKDWKVKLLDTIF